MTVLDYSIVVVYLTAIVVVGLLLQKRASSGIDSYFLGNRGIPWWALGASGMASNLDVSGTMINTAWVFTLGVAGLFLEIRGGVTLIMAFLMIFMGKWNRRAQVMTMAEWMKFRFGPGMEGTVARIMSAVSAIVVTVAMITYFAIGSGKFISTFLGFPDIGQISKSMTVEEKDAMNQFVAQFTADWQSTQEAMHAEMAAHPSAKVVDMMWKDVETAWQQLNDNPTKVSMLKQMDQDLKKNRTAVLSFERAVDEIGKPSDELKTRTAQLVQTQEGMTAWFEHAFDYRVIIPAETLAALLMICLAMFYTVASGLYGVVWTDVLQGLIIFGTIGYICVTALLHYHIPEFFNISVPMRDGTFQIVHITRDSWTSLLPPWKLHFPQDSIYSPYNLFGIAVIFYLIKVTFEGSGGTSGYMIQRYFASRSDREAGLLSLFWTFLLSFRWPFIAAIAIMGISYGASQGVISDPETVLPVVVNNLIPIGIKGLLVSGLIAAAMSTFDSTVNAGAAYWVKDIYQAYINPKASEKKLMSHSRWASILIVFFGLLFSLAVRNINEIWGWITMSIGAGMVIPTLVRWYWWRMNGYGYTFGIAAGMVAAILQKALWPNIPEYSSFIIAAGSSFVGMLAGTYLTKPTDHKVLETFYKTTRPFGFWNPVRKDIPDHVMQKINLENRQDLRSIFLAVPWQLVLFLMWMMMIMKAWHNVLILVILLVLLSVGLYFSWFRHLSTEVKVDE